MDPALGVRDLRSFHDLGCHREHRRRGLSASRIRTERGWQELQVDIIEVEPRSLRLDAFVRPGSPCVGSGLYHEVKPGLRIEFPDGIVVTVLETPPGDWRVRLDRAGIQKTLQFEDETEVRAGDLKMKGRTRLLLIEKTD